MSILVTGGAGFIGANLVGKLCQYDSRVIVIDNLLYGDNLTHTDEVLLIKANLSDELHCEQAFLEALSFGEISEVWHLAANSDVALGVDNPQVDLNNTFMTTYNVINQMRKNNIKRFYFASTSAVYGDLKGIPVNENTGPLLPISNYGAMKLASEGLVSVAYEQFLSEGLIFRFPNVVGTPATHGVILDFVKKIIKKGILDVLGDGTQRKSYIHVNDLVDAMIYLKQRNTGSGRLEIYNIGPDDFGIFVSEIAEIVVSTFNSNIPIKYGNGNKGWNGDVPAFCYDINKLKSAGWCKKIKSKDSITRAAAEIINKYKDV